MENRTNESEEMYLETILLLGKKIGNVRAVDICLERNLAKSSVSKALGLLTKKDFIHISGSGYIILTEDGKKKAESIYYKHEIITEAFIRLGANKELAEENACRIEHVLTDQLFDIIKNHVESTRTQNKN